MKDQNTTAGTDENEDETITNVALFSSDTVDQDMSSRQLDVARRASNASYSLGRLEQDLRLLNSKWHAVEKEMSERDEQILVLQRKLSAYEGKSDELEADLADLHSERDSLASELEASRAEIDDWKTRESESDQTVLARESELAVAQREQETLLEEKKQLEEELNQGKQTALSNDEQLAKLDAQDTELRVHIQELQDYIDGRKADWDSLNSQLREYEDTLKGISSSLESHDDVVAKKEEEKAGLALKVMELERELAELKGRHKENLKGQAELQQTLDDKARELGGLNTEVISLHKEIEKLQKKLKGRDATVQSLSRDLKEHGSDSSELKDQLMSEKASNSELRAKLDAASERIAELASEQKERESNTDGLGVTIGELREKLRLAEPTIEQQGTDIVRLEESLQQSQAAEEELREQFAKSTTELAQESARATEFEIRAAELEAELLEVRSDQQSIESELDAQRELVQVLERELNTKQEDLDLLDRSVDRLSAIGSGIRELDVQIDDHWCEQPERILKQAEDVFDADDEVFLQPEELFSDPSDFAEHVIVSEDEDLEEPIRYPLAQKVITIGRSRNSDIRINSKYISRVHARIKVDGGRVTIEDAGSTNGFLVNSRQSRRHTLSHGDHLEIGTNKFQYLNLSSA